MIDSDEDKEKFFAPIREHLKAYRQTEDSLYQSDPMYRYIIRDMEEDSKKKKEGQTEIEYLHERGEISPEEEKAALKYDNCAANLFGQVEPIQGNLAQRRHFLPLVFSSILPAPFALFRAISFSARTKDSADYNSRMRIMLFNSKYPLKCVCDIGFRFFSLLYHKKQENDIADKEVVETSMREYHFTLLIAPDGFYYGMDSEVCFQAFDVSPAPLIYPGEYMEIRGTAEFVSQLHFRSVYPYVWPPQQNRHVMDICDGYFHYTFGAPLRPGYVIIATFRPFHTQGGLGFQLKAGPYRQTPLSLFGYFDSPKPCEIQGTDDDFEFLKPEYGRYFPFVFNAENRVAILMGEDEFVIAINGKLYHKYRYRQSKLPRYLTDFKINCDKGLRVICSSVDSTIIPNFDTPEADAQLANFSKLETVFPHDFYLTSFGKAH